MTSRVPRKQRNLKGANQAASDASVEVAESNCSEDVTLQQVNRYELYGFGKVAQTYQEGQVTSWTSDEDNAKQVNGRGANGEVKNIRDSANLISRAISNSLSTNASNHYFSTVGTGVTASSPACFVYGKNGPQAGYIPQLVHGSGLGTSQEYVFFLPSSITGSGGSNMPPPIVTGKQNKQGN